MSRPGCGFLLGLVAGLMISLSPRDNARANPRALHAEISIRRVADTRGNQRARRLAHDPTDGRLYCLLGDGGILRVDVDTGVSKLIHGPGDTGIASPAAFAIGPNGDMFIVGNITRGSTNRGVLYRGFLVSPDSDERVWSKVMETLDYPRSNTPFDHNFNGIVVSPDGRYLFVNSGSRTDHGEVQDNGGMFEGARELPLTSAVFRIPADADNLVLVNDEETLRSEGYLFADGVRNAYDLAFAPDGELFSTENAGDRDDPEELNWLREGRHYGFPWRMGMSDTPQQFDGYVPENDRLINPAYFAAQNGFFHDDPDYPPPPPGVSFTDPLLNEGPDADKFRDPDTGEILDASSMGLTLSTLSGHRSPLGLVFDRRGALGDEFRGDGFVLSWTPATDNTGPLGEAGEDLLHLELTRLGDSYRVSVTRIVEGFDRPIDAEIIGSKIYVLELGGDGAVWEVSFPEAETPSFRRGLVNNDPSMDISDAVAVLSYLFIGGVIPCRDAADVDDDGETVITDAIYLLSHLFLGGLAPPPPHTACGGDPTADLDGDIGCEGDAGCG